MEQHLVQMFKHLNTGYMALESRLKAEGFKLRVLQVFKAWEEWAVYQREFLIKLKHIFLGLPLVIYYFVEIKYFLSDYFEFQSLKKNQLTLMVLQCLVMKKKMKI